MADNEKWALVAGGSGGVGAAIARSLAEDGWNVAITYNRNEGRARSVAQEIEDLGQHSAIAQLDLKDAAGTAAIVKTITGGVPLSGVVYAAGPQLRMNYIINVSPSAYQETFLADAIGCYNLLQPSIPQLRETKGQALAVVTPAITRYAKKDILSAAPKAAVQQIVRGIAAEEGRNGVRANCIGVGLLEGSGMWGELVASGDYTEELLTASRRNIPLRHFGDVTDVGMAAQFLMSPRARWITGQTLNVDGGYSV